MLKSLNIAGRDNDSVRTNSSEQLINWFPEIGNQEDRFPAILRPTAGLAVTGPNGWTVANYDAVRGLLDHRGVLYAVMADNGGSDLFSMTRTSGTYYATSLSNGGITTTDGLVRMAASNEQIMIVDGTNGYIYDTSTATFSQITDPDFPSSPTDVTYQDGYFIVISDTDHRFYLSGLEDGLSWDALDFASATGHPDRLVGCLSDHRELWLFGEHSTEVWYNSGDATFPFAKREGILIQKGLAAKNTVARVDNSIFWLAEDETGTALVVRAEGYTPKIISTNHLSREINSYTTISDAQAYAYTLGGNIFYVLSFPTDNKSWMYCLNSGQWCQLETYNGTSYDRHRSNCYAFHNNRHVVGDTSSGRLFHLDLDTYTDNTLHIRRVRRTAHLNQHNANITINQLTLEMKKNVGDTLSGEDVDPQVVLRISKDGGYTWGAEMVRNFGQPGATGKRVKWDMLGQGRYWVFEFVVTDPVNAVLIGATIDVVKDRS